MRKLLLAVTAVLVLGLGAVFAQSPTPATVPSRSWIGFSFGYPGFSGHFGASNLFGPGISLRGNLGFSYVGYGFSVGADALYTLPVNTGDLPLTVYLGGGPTIFTGGGFAVGAELFGGAEYRLGTIGFAPGGVFFELGPSFLFTRGFSVFPVGRVGFNYHF
jgi:hypothetical protein